MLATCLPIHSSPKSPFLNAAQTEFSRIIDLSSLLITLQLWLALGGPQAFGINEINDKSISQQYLM